MQGLDNGLQVFMSRFTPFTTKCFEKPIPKEFFRCSLRAAFKFRRYSLKQCRGFYSRAVLGGINVFTSGEERVP